MSWVTPKFARQSHAAIGAFRNAAFHRPPQDRPFGFDSHRPLHFSLSPFGLCPRRGIRAVLRFQGLDAPQFQSLASAFTGLSWRGLQHAKSSGRAAYLCANPPNTRMDEPKRLPYNITNRKNGCKPIWRSQQLPVKVRRLSPKKCGPLRISSPAIEFISRFLRTARLLYV